LLESRIVMLCDNLKAYVYRREFAKVSLRYAYDMILRDRTLVRFSYRAWHCAINSIRFIIVLFAAAKAAVVTTNILLAGYQSGVSPS